MDLILLVTFSAIFVLGPILTICVLSLDGDRDQPSQSSDPHWKMWTVNHNSRMPRLVRSSPEPAETVFSGDDRYRVSGSDTQQRHENAEEEWRRGELLQCDELDQGEDEDELRRALICNLS